MFFAWVEQQAIVSMTHAVTWPAKTAVTLEAKQLREQPRGQRSNYQQQHELEQYSAVSMMLAARWDSKDTN